MHCTVTAPSLTVNAHCTTAFTCFYWLARCELQATLVVSPRVCLTVYLSVYLSVCLKLLMLYISETKRFWGSRPRGSGVCLRCVDCRLMTSSMTSRHSMTSYSWRYSIQSRRICKLRTESTILVDPITKHTLPQNIVFKKISPFG